MPVTKISKFIVAQQRLMRTNLLELSAWGRCLAITQVKSTAWAPEPCSISETLGMTVKFGNSGYSPATLQDLSVRRNKAIYSIQVQWALLYVMSIMDLKAWISGIFFCLEGSWGQPQGPNFPSPWATMLALRLDCSTAALTTPQTVISIWKLVELKMLDFSDCTRTGISILTSAAD